MIPTAFVSEKIDVTKPDNTKAQIDNPLFDYDFHPLDNKEINGTVSRIPLSKLGNPYSSKRPVLFLQLGAHLMVTSNYATSQRGPYAKLKPQHATRAIMSS
jgi:hypothetical protein